MYESEKLVKHLSIGTDLIVGGAGFVGSHLTKFLSSMGRQVVVLDNLSMGNQLVGGTFVELIKLDVNDLAATYETLVKWRPENIYHLAANSDISRSAAEPMVDIRNTLSTTGTLLQAMAASGVNSNLMFASSSAVYGPKSVSIPEDTVAIPISPYGWMKLGSEGLLKNAIDTGVVKKLLIARFPNVTGERLTHGVVYDLVKKLRQNNNSLEILGDGHQTKPYIDVKNLVAAIVGVFTNDWIGEQTLNFAPEGSTSVREIVKDIIEVSGLSPRLHYGDTPEGWRGDIPNYVLDTSKLRSLYPSFELGRSNEAIRKSVEWAWQNA